MSKPKPEEFTPDQLPSIEEFRSLLGDDFKLFKRLWKIFSSKEGNKLMCLTPLGEIDNTKYITKQCTILQKALLACVGTAKNGSQKAQLLRAFSLNVYEEFGLPHGTTFTVRGSFTIVAEINP
jgi:hypothetical protein